MNVAATALMGLALAAPLASGQDVVEITQGGAPGGESDSLGAVAEEVEIMRLVLTKELNRAALGARAEDLRRPLYVARSDDTWFAGVEADGEDAEDLRVVLRPDGQVTTHTRGFYAPGIGAWFDTEIATPVVTVRATGDEDDLWEESAREVRRGPTDATTSTAARYQRLWSADVARARLVSGNVRRTLDPAAIDRAVDGVVEALARYGHRLEGVPRGEDVVVALRFVPDTQVTRAVPMLQDIPLLAHAFQEAGVELEVSAATVIVRVAKRDLGDPGADGERGHLRDRARITRY